MGGVTRIRSLFKAPVLTASVCFSVLLLPALAAIGQSFFVRKRFGELHDLPALVHGTSIALLAIGALETVVLVALYLLLSRNAVLLRNTWVRVAGALALACMLGTALRAPTDGDAWAYVGYGIVPTMAQAYDTPQQPFAGDFHRINDEWGTPMLPAIYGPVWIEYLHLLVGHAPSLAAAVLLLKAAAVVFFFAFLALLVKLETPPVLVAVIAINPAFIDEFVTGVHNDLPAVVLSLLALLALETGRRIPAVLLLGAAVLIKVTFLAVGLTVLAGHGTLRERLLWLSGVVAITAAGIAVGGAPFVHAMTMVGGGWLHAAPMTLILQGAVAAVAAFAILAAFVGNRWYPSAVWSFSAMNAMFYSWYQAWGIPFAVRTSRSWTAAAFFIAWPIVQPMIHAPVWKFNQSLVLMLMFLVFAVSMIVARVSQRRTITPLSASQAA